MALSLDASFSGSATATSAPTVTVSTGVGGDIIVLVVVTSDSTNLRTVSSISDGSSLVWNKRAASSYTGGTFNTHNDVELWWAYSAATQTNDIVTAHLSGSVGVALLLAFGVKGFTGTTYITAPWDTNVALPAIASSTSGTATTPTVNVSTTNANTMILGVCGCQANMGSTAGSGYTFIVGGSQFDASVTYLGGAIAQEQVVSSPQTSLADTMGHTSGGWLIIGDALAQTGGSATVHQMPSMGFG